MVAAILSPDGARALEEVLDFEELEPLCVASTTVGDWGSGPVRIHGTSHRFGSTNVAIVVDTEHPGPGDADLSTKKYHNAIVISRLRPAKPAGPEAAWLAGSVPIVDDEDIPGATITFDFAETGLVTFYGLTLLDHNNYPAKIRIYQAPESDRPLASLEDRTSLDLTWGHRRLFSGPRQRARLTVPGEDQPFHKLQVGPAPLTGRHVTVPMRELRALGRDARSLVGRDPILPGGIPDVTKIEVELGGSSAVDRLIFSRQGTIAPATDDDLFARIESRIADVIQPQLEELRDDFVTRWQELTDNPTPTLRADLDNLIVDLETRLLGAETEDGTRAGGLLQCPELPCGCPELRALQAWVQDRVGKIRADLAVDEDAGQEIEETPTTAAARPEVRIAALEPAAYLAAAQTGDSIELAQQSRSEGCESGTFWQQFFCEGQVLFKGVSGVVASILGTRVELSADTVLVAGVTKSCEAFRLTPKSADFSHVETGILPGTARRVPRGLYCVLCRTAEHGLQPYSTLDLVEDKDARPAPVGDEAARCAVTG